LTILDFLTSISFQVENWVYLVSRKERKAKKNAKSAKVILSVLCVFFVFFRILRKKNPV